MQRRQTVLRCGFDGVLQRPEGTGIVAGALRGRRGDRRGLPSELRLRPRRRLRGRPLRPEVGRRRRSTGSAPRRTRGLREGVPPRRTGFAGWMRGWPGWWTRWSCWAPFGAGRRARSPPRAARAAHLVPPRLSVSPPRVAARGPRMPKWSPETGSPMPATTSPMPATIGQSDDATSGLSVCPSLTAGYQSGRGPGPDRGGRGGRALNRPPQLEASASGHSRPGWKGRATGPDLLNESEGLVTSPAQRL